MKNTSRNVKKKVSAIALMIVFGAVGCTSKDEKNDILERKAIIDNYAEIILLQDKDSENFDKALSAVGAYVGEVTPEHKTTALETMEETIAQFEADSEECTSYEADEAFRQMLEKHGISFVEYQMNAESRYTYLQDYIQDLEFLGEYLAYAEEDELFMEDLRTTYEFMEEEQQLMRAYNYTGINYWFAGWGEEEEDYVKQVVFDKLTSFSAQDTQWEDSREAVEEKMNACLDEVEELYNKWTAYIGESWDALNDMY